jgi:hypothetical protein
VAVTYEDRVCVECGRKFTPRTHNQTRCCKECARANDIKYKRALRKRVGKMPYVKQCALCDAEFVTTSGNAIYCSDECRRIAKNRQTAMSRKRMRGCVVLDSDALARRAVEALDEQTVSRLRELFRRPIQEVLTADDVDEHVATIMTETDDGITGRAWCSRCGGSVHRSSHYCRHCGARFEKRQDDVSLSRQCREEG